MHTIYPRVVYWNTQFILKLYGIFYRIRIMFLTEIFKCPKHDTIFILYIFPVNPFLFTIKIYWKIILANYANQSIKVQIFDYFLCKIIIITV